MFVSRFVKLIDSKFELVVNTALAETDPSVTVDPAGVEKVTVLPKALAPAKEMNINPVSVFPIDRFPMPKFWSFNIVTKIPP